MNRLFHTCIAALFIPAAAFAQEEAPPAENPDEKPEKWDVSAPQEPTRAVEIDVEEGTWMSLDVSPDGRTIAFDLLGDIYTMPISGGTAAPIASGTPWEIQPRYSHDGARIAFTSDRGGGDNIWIMNPDGSDKRQVTKESFRLLNNPTWSPDSRFIAARKHFTTGRSLGTGEIWLYHVSGGGGVMLVARPNEVHQKELGEPVFSHDGSVIYYIMNTTPGPIFQYAQDSNDQIFEILRYDMATGEIDAAVSGAGGAVRPTPSPDGRHIAFVRRVRAKSMLFLKDLHSGEERIIYDGLDQDMQEVWAVQGAYPNMDWTPDGRTLVFWAGGKIRKWDRNSGNVSVIPFRVQDTRDVIDPPRPSVAVAPETITTKMVKFASVSPDGGRVVFESLGKLYVKSLPSGRPRRLTSDRSGDFELYPAWSRDGRSIVFVSWNDEDLGSIRRVSASGGRPARVTREPGHYSNPQFSPDGESIVFDKGTGGFLTDGKWSERPGIYIVDADGGTARRITDSGGDPHFGAQNDRIFVTRNNAGARALVSIDLNGEAERVHASSQLTRTYYIAPSGRHVAFHENYHLYVMPLTVGPHAIPAGREGSALPVVKASGDGALYPSWSGGGTSLHWTLGPVLYKAGIEDMMPSAPKAGEEDEASYTPPTEGISLSMNFDADKPSGTIALTGAKVVTMASEDGGVIENGTVVIEDNRIVMVGPTAAITIPRDVEIIDVSGKTIIPGLIDAHAHGAQGTNDLVPQQNWSAIAHLAFGVTTVFDPSNIASHIFAAAEMQQAGIILAPRLFSTGEVVYGAQSPGFYAVVNSMDEAREHVRRLKAQGAHGIKNYNQPRRDQRQQVAAASREENILVVAEGASLFHMDMSLVQDGNTAVEHNIPQSKLYEDVLSFMGATKVANTPTLNVAYGGLAAENYWYQVDDVWKHPILSRHVPPHILQPRTVRRLKAPEEDYYYLNAARVAKSLADRGVYVSIGAHGQREGLGSHWDLWSFVQGGMTPIEALRAGTIVPAIHLGFADDIGSLEPGKLADLVVIDGDPLSDIRQSDRVSHVMLNGRLYRTPEMNEVVSGDRQRHPYYWEK